MVDVPINKITNDIADDPDQGTFGNLTICNSIQDQNGDKKLDFVNNKTFFNRAFTSQITFKDDFSTISDPVAGCIAYDSNNDTLKIYTGNSWKDVGGNISIDGGDIQGALEVDSLKVKAGNLTVVNDGKLGIGKSNPSELLDVNGNIKSSGNIHGDKLIADNDIEGVNLTITETVNAKNVTATETIQGEHLTVEGSNGQEYAMRVDNNSSFNVTDQNGIDLFNMRKSGVVNTLGTSSKVLAEYMLPYDSEGSNGLTYLAFEYPDDLGWDSGTRGWNADELTGDITYKANVTDDNDMTMRHVARFNGTSRISFDTRAEYDFIRGFSVWFRTNTSNSVQTLFHLGFGSGNTHEWTIHVLSDGRIRNRFRRNNNTEGQVVTDASYDDNNWHFVQTSVGGGGPRLAVDGQVFTPSSTTNNRPWSSGFIRLNMGLGSMGRSENRPFVGDISEVILWSSDDVGTNAEFDYPLLKEGQNAGRHTAHSFHTKPQGSFSAGTDQSLRLRHDDNHAKIETFKRNLIFETQEDDNNGEVEFINKGTTNMRLSSNGNLFTNSLAIGSGYSELTSTQTNPDELYVERKIGIGTTEPQAKLDINGDVKIHNENVELVNVSNIGEVEHKRTKTDVVAETLRPYVNDQPQGFIYLSFEDPENLAKDFSTNGWDGVVQSNVSYVSNFEDSNGFVMKNVARIDGGSINLNAFADHDFIRSVSFWFRLNQEISGVSYLIELRGAGSSFWHNHWTLQIEIGNLRNMLRVNQNIIASTTSDNVNDQNWHFVVATVGGTNSTRMWVDGQQYGRDSGSSTAGPEAFNRNELLIRASGGPVDFAEFTLWYDQMEDEAEHKLIQNSYKLGRNFALQFKTRDNGAFTLGDNDDLVIRHDGVDSKIINKTGDLVIQSNDVKIQGDLDVNGKLKLDDDVDVNGKLQFGNDLEIEHDGTNSKITATTGDLIIQSNEVKIQDNIDVNGKLKIDNELESKHDNSITTLKNNTGQLQILNEGITTLIENSNPSGGVNVKFGSDDTNTKFTVRDSNNTTLFRTQAGGLCEIQGVLTVSGEITTGGFDPYNPGGGDSSQPNALTSLTNFEGAFRKHEINDIGGYDDDGRAKYHGGVLAPNGKIYCVPFSSDKVAVIDPKTDSVNHITGLSSDSSKWKGGVLAKNGKIYCAPFDADNVSIIDPITDTVDTTTITIPSNHQLGQKWNKCCLAPHNGKIYCAPHQHDHILVINLEDDTIDFIPLPSQIPSVNHKFQGATITRDGKIVFSVLNIRKFLFINPIDDSMVTYDWSGILPIKFNFSGVVHLPDGKIGLIPRDSNTVFILNPTTGQSAGFKDLTFTDTPNAWSGGILAQNGLVYCSPFGSNKILIIDFANSNPFTFSTIQVTSIVNVFSKFKGAVLGPNNRIYFIPFNSSKTMTVNTGFFTTTDDWVTKAYFNKR